jgi:phosphoglycolate phosphatase-like HAD superfamily hydrolase
LIRTDGVGKRGLNRAFAELYGINNVMDGMSLAGQTDDKIMMSAYAAAGMEFSYQELSRFKNVYFNIIADEIQKDGHVRTLMPGIAELLPELNRRPDIYLGLLTGNWQKSGRIKIDFFGLNSYFPFGAFADDASERADLVPIAMQRFADKYGINIKAHDVYVIGDTPADVHCTKPHGVVSVAVAAAFHSLEELAACEPDILLQDFSDVNALKLLTE